MDADVDARPRDQRREDEEERRDPARDVAGEHDRGREARRRVSRRERDVERRVAERLLVRVRHVRARPIREELHPGRGEIGERDADECRERGPRVATPERDERGQDQPDRAQRAGVGEPDEELVELVDAVLDDPALQVVVDADEERRQARAASICFADSISCCGSNGLPMKPWAPRSVASAADCSSILPLNISTGIAPTP